MVIFFFILKKNSTCICRNKKWQDCNLATNTQLVRFNGVSPGAIFKAVSEGEKSFSAICIVGGKNGDVQDFCSPCGICRQVLSEFCKPDFKIILASSLTDFKVFTLSDLLPESFSLWWIFEMLFERNSAYFLYREDIIPFALQFFVD